MDASFELDQTQAIALDGYDEEDDRTDELGPEEEKKPAAYIKVFFQRGLTESTFPLYEGDNIVGRCADTCHVCIPSKSLSKEHACVQIVGDTHLIFDKGSRNKTRRGKLFLSPDVRYELKNADEITFADVKCVYKVSEQLIDTVAESGSETDGSESLLLKLDVTDQSTSDVIKNGKHLEDEDNSVIVSTQAGRDRQSGQSAVMAHDTPEAKQANSISKVEAPPQTLVLSESESEDEIPMTSKERQKEAIQETLLCEESDAEASRDHEGFGAATQAYVAGGGNGDSDEEPSKEDLIGAPTQAYTDLTVEDDDDETGSETLRCEPTQAFIQPADSARSKTGPQKTARKASNETSGTQSFDVAGQTKEDGVEILKSEDDGTVRRSDPAVSVTGATQVFDEDADESDDEDIDATGLFAVSTMACDPEDDVVEEDEDDEDDRNDHVDAEAETQAVDVGAPTQKIGAKDAENASSETVAVDSDATLAVEKIRPARGKKNLRFVSAEDAPTQAVGETVHIEVGDNSSGKGKPEPKDRSDLPTQVFDDTLPAESEDTGQTKRGTPVKGKGRNAKSAQDLSDAPTLAVDLTLPVTEVITRVGPGQRGRGRGRKTGLVTEASALNISETVVIDDEEEDSGLNEPIQAYDTVPSRSKRGRGRGRGRTTRQGARPATVNISDTVVIEDEDDHAGSDEPTQVFDAVPTRKGRGQTSQPTLVISDTVAVVEEDEDDVVGAAEPTQAFGAGFGDATQLVGESGDKPKMVFAAASDEPTQAYGTSDVDGDEAARTPPKRNQRAQKSGSQTTGDTQHELSDDESEDGDKPWLVKAREEATQAYGVVDGESDDDDDDNDVKETAGAEEPTQAYGLEAEDDADATQAYADEDVAENDDDTGQERGLRTRGAVNREDPTQKYDMTTEESDRETAGQGKSAEGDVDVNNTEVGDDSDSGEESMLKVDPNLADDPAQLLEEDGESAEGKGVEPTLAYDIAVEKEPRKLQNDPEPTLAYDIAVEEEPRSLRKGRSPKGKRKMGKETIGKRSADTSPEVPSQDEDTKVVDASTKQLAGSKPSVEQMSDTEEMVPDSMADGDEEANVRPPLIRLLSRSPLKSALVDRRRSPSPARKHVAFAEAPTEKEGEKQTRGKLTRSELSPSKGADKSGGSASPSSRPTRSQLKVISDQTSGGKVEEVKGQEKQRRNKTKDGEKQELVAAKTTGARGGQNKIDLKGGKESGPISAKKGGNQTETVSVSQGALSAEQGSQNVAAVASPGRGRRGRTATKGDSESADVAEKGSSGEAAEMKKDSAPPTPDKRKRGQAADVQSEESQPAPKRGRRSVVVRSGKDSQPNIPGSAGDDITKEKTPSSEDTGPNARKKSRVSVKNVVELKQSEANESDETESLASSVNENEQKVEETVRKDEKLPKKQRERNKAGDKNEDKNSPIRVSSRGRRISNNARLKDFETSAPAAKRGKFSSASNTEAGADEVKSEKQKVGETLGVSATGDGKRGRGTRSNKVVMPEENNDRNMVSTAVQSGQTKGQSGTRAAMASKEKGNDAVADIVTASGNKKDDGDGIGKEKAVKGSDVKGGKTRGRKSSVTSETSESVEKSSIGGTDESEHTASESKNVNVGSGVKGRGKRTTTGTVTAQKLEISKAATDSTRRSSARPARISSQGQNSQKSVSSTPTKSGKAQKLMQNSQADSLLSLSQSSATSSSAAGSVSKTPTLKGGRGRKLAAVTSGDTEESNSQAESSQGSTRSAGGRRGGRGSGKVSASQSDSPTSLARPCRKSQSLSQSSPIPVKKPKLADSPHTPARKSEASAEATSSPALRKSTLDHKPRVMFTGVIDEIGEKTIKDLGGELAGNVQDCTHLVTDKVRRTVKFLSGLAKGIHIVSHLWLESCKQAGTFLDASKFLVSDPAMEKLYKFTLPSSITKAAHSPLLAGYRVHVSKSVKPDPAQMQDILQCAGAEYLKTMPSKFQEKTVVISYADDHKLCQPAIKAGIPVMEAEFILTGILRQELDFNQFALFGDETSSSQSSVKGKGRRK